MVEFEEGSQIKSFKTDLFYECDYLKKIKITDDSSLQKICKSAFYSTDIKSLFIPATVDEIEDDWCECTEKLTTVIISPKNKHFKYFDNEHKIIVGKSDNNSEIFDTIIFASRDITEATIPEQIKYIPPNFFEKCSKLKSLKSSEDSEISTIYENFIPFSSAFSEFEDGWCNETPKLTEIIISPEN